MNENENNSPGFNRRDFLKSGSFATMMTMMGGVELMTHATATAAESQSVKDPVKVAVIGLGAWGREIVSALLRVPEKQKAAYGEIAALCDTYPGALRRAAKEVPNAKQVPDYKAVLEDKDIRAVVIATPTHQHKEIVLAAIKAGKHVYCEAPLANTIDDAREIAAAAKAAPYLVFQAGLQRRADPERHFLVPFIRAGSLGQIVMARAQWHNKTSWRAAAPSPEREAAVNWRMDKAISLGLMGELGSHQIDQTSWFLNANPVSVSGIGSVLFWKDGREVPDTVQALIEYPGGIYLNYDATLVSSFDADYEVLYGSEATVVLRGSNAWMFKEVDSRLFGFEVYCRKENFNDQTGIALVADASKSVPGEAKPNEVPFAKSALSHALDNFLLNANDLIYGERDYKASYGEDDVQGLREDLAKKPRRDSAGYAEGYRAAVIAIKANEAILTGRRIELKPESYELT
jgi:predicted dehydrogenase